MHDLKNAAEPGAGGAQAFADAEAGAARVKIANTLWPLCRFDAWSSPGPMPVSQNEDGLVDGVSTTDEGPCEPKGKGKIERYRRWRGSRWAEGRGIA